MNILRVGYNPSGDQGRSRVSPVYPPNRDSCATVLVQLAKLRVYAAKKSLVVFMVQGECLSGLEHRMKLLAVFTPRRQLAGMLPKAATATAGASHRGTAESLTEGLQGVVWMRGVQVDDRTERLAMTTEDIR